MRVYFLCSFNKNTGVGRYGIYLLKEFVKLNIDITPIFFGNSELPINLDLNYIKIPLKISNKYLRLTLYPLLSKRYLKSHDFDILHSNGTYYLEPDILTLHEVHRCMIRTRKFWHLKQVLPWEIATLQYEKKNLRSKKIKKIICLSEGEKDEVINFYGVPEEKITVIPNGVDLNEFRPDKEKREKIRQKLGIGENEILLLFTGHEFERKGLRYLIEALPMLKDKNIIKLVVIGKDNPEPYKRLAQKLEVLDKVKFIGFVPDITLYYSASDVFVFPTAYEAFSLATLEAIASGLPILATRVNGTRELIKEGYNGFFIERDPTNIAEKINILIEDVNLRKQMSRNARKTAEKYSWDKIAKRYVEVYEEVSKK